MVTTYYSTIYNTIDFRNFIVFFLGRDPGTLKSDIVSTKTSTNNLFGFETLKLKIRRLKLWKPTVEAARAPRRAAWERDRGQGSESFSVVWIERERERDRKQISLYIYI